MPEVEFDERIADLIEKAEADLDAAEAELLKAEEAGIDVTEQRKAFEAKLEELRRIKAVYGK